MAATTPITVAHGDGIGPEIMTATLRVLEAAGAALEVEAVEAGEKAYLGGNPSGLGPAAWESVRRTRVFLKAPVTTPRGAGYQSLNVSARKALALFANVRPCVSYHPIVETRHPGMDVVIIRENEEDVYAGLEYRLSGDVTQCIKLISRPGCERIVRYAFEYARLHGRRKVTCITKDNVMQMTDGLFHQVFDEIAAGYPELASDHWIVDIGAAKLADTPEAFDVIVAPNLYGDILSDVAAHAAGSVGLAASANIGEQCAMFEAMHGSAPRRGGQNLANPSGLLLGAVLLLVHIDQPEAAGRVHNAWLRTLEDGIHTYDVHTHGASSRKVGTQEFADAVIERLGRKPYTLQPVSYARPSSERPRRAARAAAEPKKELVGVDVYVDWPSRDAAALANRVEQAGGGVFKLAAISNRGVNVWPAEIPEVFCTGSFRCRFLSRNGAVSQMEMVALLGRLAEGGLEVAMTESLRTFDGRPGYSQAQGQ